MSEHLMEAPPADHQPFTGRLSQSEATRLMRCGVLVAGLGNIGAALAILLARLGVGKIRLVDRDQVEAKNLRNQSYGSTADVGRNKADVIAEQIQRLNPEITVDAISVDLADLPLGKTADVDLCFGGLDSLYARQLYLNEQAYVQGIPAIDGGVDAGGDWLGKVQTFVPGGACLECGWSAAHYQQVALETPCDPEDDPTGPSTLAPALLGTMVAGVMAAEGVKLLLGHHPHHSFELAFDLASRRWLQSRLRENKQCRFDHRVIDEVIPLSVPLADACVRDLLAVLDQFDHSSVQVHFRRNLLAAGPLRSNRFPSLETLQSLADIRLAELGFSRDDRIRVDSGDRSAFVVFGKANPNETSQPGQRT